MRKKTVVAVVLCCLLASILIGAFRFTDFKQDVTVPVGDGNKIQPVGYTLWATSVSLLPAPGTVFIYQESVPLTEELQKHTFMMAGKYNVPYKVLLAIMWHESRFIADVADNLNDNGTLDRGLMQINEVNWDWIQELGLDISLPMDNIEAGACLLNMFWEKYTPEEALAAYAAGETGMSEGYGFVFAEEIIEMVYGDEKDAALFARQ